MGAREKLNASNFAGSLLVAAIIGFATGSFAVFLLSAAILIGISCYTGDIRPGRHGW
jgi:hypothetical protein